MRHFFNLKDIFSNFGTLSQHFTPFHDGGHYIKTVFFYLLTKHYASFKSFSQFLWLFHSFLHSSLYLFNFLKLSQTVTNFFTRSHTFTMDLVESFYKITSTVVTVDLNQMCRETGSNLFLFFFHFLHQPSMYLELAVEMSSLTIPTQE